MGFDRDFWIAGLASIQERGGAAVEVLAKEGEGVGVEDLLRSLSIDRPQHDQRAGRGNALDQRHHERQIGQVAVVCARDGDSVDDAVRVTSSPR